MKRDLAKEFPPLFLSAPRYVDFFALRSRIQMSLVLLLRVFLFPCLTEDNKKVSSSRVTPKQHKLPFSCSRPRNSSSFVELRQSLSFNCLQTRNEPAIHRRLYHPGLNYPLEYNKSYGGHCYVEATIHFAVDQITINSGAHQNCKGRDTKTTSTITQ